MQRISSPAGVTVSFDRSGGGPPLILVHGSFSDHRSNWELVAPMFRNQFTMLTVARRGRGETDATEGESLEDEAADIAAVIAATGQPVFLLGHSYGAHCALLAALRDPSRVRKLVLYEPPRPSILTDEALAKLEGLAAAGSWDRFAATFLRDMLAVPPAELEALRATPDWPPIVADARASLGDLRAINRFRFDAAPARRLALPVLLQIGSESPRNLYVTDALMAVLPNARIGELAGQAHEGMTSAPEMYARAVTDFLLG